MISDVWALWNCSFVKIIEDVTLFPSRYTASPTPNMNHEKEKQGSVTGAGEVDHGTGELVNASGHVQELRRHFSLLSLAGVGLTVGNVWPAVGGSILVALYNGGPPGISPSSWLASYKLSVYRCAVRIHRRQRLLLACRSLNRRASISHSLLCRCIPMGFDNSWTEMGSGCRLLCWVLELACVGLWGRQHVAHLRKSSSSTGSRKQLSSRIP